MKLARASGILLHLTSLPSRYGIGDLGRAAYDFVDFLKESKQGIWQILPFNPVGFHWSPYLSPSAFAGNPLFLCMDKLVEEGLLAREEVKNIPEFSGEMVLYEDVQSYKEKLLRGAYARFNYQRNEEYHRFREKNAFWLEDYALFMVLKEQFKGQAWNYWDKPFAQREKKFLNFLDKHFRQELEYHYFLQFSFSKQWKELKQYATSRNIKIVGDLPIFISYDSSDTWAHPHLFQLDDTGNPTKLAGVPPDYFSATGQLWGNPHYNWQEMAEDDYGWWRSRLKQALEAFDYIRIDHFRGFTAYWEVPAGERTAIGGQWVTGPGEHFFLTVKKYLGQLPVIAEDLGVITPDVIELREKCGFPGMKVLQFLSEEKLAQEEEVVYYTGTHDNDTLRGWYEENVQAFLNNPLPEAVLEDRCWELIETVFKSKAKWAIFPLQDVLCLASHARMNIPGTVGGNWQWRFRKEMLTKEISDKLASLSIKYKRNEG